MKKKVLVIDDDRINAKIVKLNLTKEGFHVETVFDGDEGLAIVETVAPDLIVLDVNMPNMNGYTFMLELQKIQSQKDKPVIVLTAQADVRPIFKFNGVKDYLIKPISGPDLVEKVKKHVH